MSWLHKLHETYEHCKDREQKGAIALMPICHTTQLAHIEVVIDGNGTFRRAQVLEKKHGTTLIPCTEESGGRSGSKPVNHPLCDKLQYLAGDFLRYGGEVTAGFAKDAKQPHRDYVRTLSAWSLASPHPKLAAILRYVQRSTLVADLIQSGILHVDPDTHKLLSDWSAGKASAPAIFRAMPAGQTQGDAFIRFRVELGDEPNSATWTDDALISAWVGYYQSNQTKRGFCMVTGEETTLAVQHPAKLRNAGDRAKLISANDDSGLTYRGKFTTADEALGVGFVATQKAHNALRWLITRQGYRSGDQAFIAWETSGKPIPDPCLASYEAFGIDGLQSFADADTGQAFALQLKQALGGYQAKLEPRDTVMVMGLDSATPGRMAITYYREIKGSDFLIRIEAWHTAFAWPQDYDKDCKSIGAPAPRDIAEAAYGIRLDDKLRTTTVERLIPCIVDGLPLPIDLLRSAVRRASNRAGQDRQAWEKTLGIACALFKGFFKEREYLMALEQERTSRDYLFGRLLAIAENLESYALYVAGEKGRDTSAARLMQRFADRPASTWRTIALNLRPYISRLRNLRPGVLHKKETLLDEVTCKFNPDDFLSDKPLSGEFLLGYHCQRRAMRPPEQEATDEQSTTTQATTSGESA